VAKVTVELVSQLPAGIVGKIKIIEGKTKFTDLRSISEEQKKYFHQAYAAFLQNINCWDFFTLNVESRAESENHPLKRALTELWLGLAVNQGEMASDCDLAVYVFI